MAFRILSRAMAAPSKTSALRFADSLSGHGYPMTLLRSKASTPIFRQLAVSAVDGDGSNENSGTNGQAWKDSNSSPSRRHLGLNRRGAGANPTNHFLAPDIWDPLLPSRSLRQMLDTVDRLFDNPFFPSQPSQALSSTMRPPWDVAETDHSYKLRFDMPGLSKEEVKVTVEDGDLVIKGEHKKEEKSESSWTSRMTGSYSTRVTLPDNVKLDEVKAKFKNGVLEVEVPKLKEAPKKNVIDISVN